MRIICPACAAEYEVDDAAIPPEGRDVQCSNCTRAWFQLPTGPMVPADGETAPAAEAPVAKTPPVEAPVDRTASAPSPAAVSSPASSAEVNSVPADAGAAKAGIVQSEQEAEDEDETDEGTVAPKETAPPPPAPPRASLDEALREVLRAEADRESAARRAEAATLETQTELGLAAPRPAASAAQAVAGPARTGSTNAAAGDAGGGAAPVADAGAGARPARKRLPDIEEVDPLLAPRPAEPMPEVEEQAARRGFRLGFLLVLAVALALVMIYLFGRMRPEPGPLLASYVALVDDARLMLSERLGALVRRLTQMMGGG